MESQLREIDMSLKRKQDANQEMLSQFKDLSQKLDHLLMRAKNKKFQDDQKGMKNQCNHGQLITRLEGLISQKEQEISQAKRKFENMINGKQKEMQTVQDKINKVNREIRRVSENPQSDNERLAELDSKIKEKEEQISDLVKEIKALKKLQHDQGKELVGLNNSEQYQSKIKKLMEETRYYREKIGENENKTEQEEATLIRIQEKLFNLEQTKSSLSHQLSQKRKSVNPDQEESEALDLDDMTLSELLGQISSLESQVQSKEKENQLLLLRLKTTSIATPLDSSRSKLSLLKSNMRKDLKSASKNGQHQASSPSVSVSTISHAKNKDTYGINPVKANSGRSQSNISKRQNKSKEFSQNQNKSFVAGVREEVNKKNYSSISIMPLIKEKERKNKSVMRGQEYTTKLNTQTNKETKNKVFSIKQAKEKMKSLQQPYEDYTQNMNIQVYQSQQSQDQEKKFSVVRQNILRELNSSNISVEQSSDLRYNVRRKNEGSQQESQDIKSVILLNSNKPSEEMFQDFKTQLNISLQQ